MYDMLDELFFEFHALQTIHDSFSENSKTWRGTLQLMQFIVLTSIRHIQWAKFGSQETCSLSETCHVLS